jgi:vacuolar-type H+-ATPase subunit E/Vma4
MLNNIEVLSRVILEDAASEAGALLDNAKKEEAFIKEKNIQEIERLKKDPKKNKIHMDLVCDKAKMISLAEFRARSEILGLKEEILSPILNEMYHEFLSLTENKQYPLLLKKLIIDALTYLKDEGEEFVCRIKDKDRSLLPASIFKEVSEQCNKRVSLDKMPVDILGGVVVFRADYRVLYDNSLEAIFQRKRGQIRCTLAKILF